MAAPSPRRLLLDHMELVLTGIGVVIIVTVPLLPFVPEGWMSIAVTAVGVGIVHGLLFWVVRRRQRRDRRETLKDVRTMLRERIGDQLHVLLRTAAQPTRKLDPKERARLSEIVHAVREVETALEVLSEESLLGWKSAATNLSESPQPENP